MLNIIEINFITVSIEIIVNFLFLLVGVAYFTLLERKILGSVQRRNGPVVTGFWGLLQPLSDGLKLLLKEFILPKRSRFGLFIFSPIWSFCISYSYWAIIPLGFDNFLVIFEYAMLFVIALSGLNVYGIVFAGWSSNSRYSLLGSLRSASQMVSYEIVLSVSISPLIVWSGSSFNFFDISFYQKFYDIWYCIPFFPVLIIFFITSLAETNRTPFDLPEAEAELVSGFNVEYSSTPFALFFLAEYCSILVMSAILTILFFGGFIYSYFSMFIFLLFIFLFVLVRSELPRFRYDQLMSLCWKNLLPISLGFCHFYIGLIFFEDIIFICNNLFLNIKINSDFVIITILVNLKNFYIIVLNNFNEFSIFILNIYFNKLNDFLWI